MPRQPEPSPVGCLFLFFGAGVAVLAALRLVFELPLPWVIVLLPFWLPMAVASLAAIAGAAVGIASIFRAAWRGEL